MPSVTIPLAGVLNTRKQIQLVDSVGNVDQLFRNCDFDVVKNPITGDAKMYIQKRFGLQVYLTPESSSTGPSTAFLVSVTGDIISSYTLGTSNIYIGTTSVGATGSNALHISEASISGKQYYFITTASGTGWYFVSDSYAQTAYTGNRTSGSPVISGIASTAGMYAGQAIAGDAGIPADTRILSVDSSSQITLTANATSGAATSTALTKTPLAKFIFTNFPATIVGKFVYLDGRLFIMDKTNKRIYQSGDNNVTTWGASEYITVQSSGEATAGIARVGNRIAALCAASIEFFYNAGNPSGSVLTSQKELFRRVGVSGGSATDSSSVVPIYCYSGDTVFFLGTVGGQSRGVYAMSGTEITKISTPEIDRQISRSASGVYWIISAFHDRGKNYVCVSENQNPARKFMGCLETGMWPEHSILNESTGYIVFSGGIVGYTGASTTDTSMVFCVATGGQSGQKGVVYRLRNDVYADNGASFTLSCQTSKTDFGTENLKTVKNVALLGSDIQGAINYLSLDGSGYASTPDSASFTFSSAIEVVVKAALTDYTPSSSQWIAAQDTTGAAASAWRLYINTSGNLIFEVSNGSSYVQIASTAATGLTNGDIRYIKANYTFNDGGGNRVGNFYYSIDGSTYTQIGSTVTTAGTVTMNSSSTNVTLGAHAGGAGNLIGNIYYAEVRNGISGTVVAKFDPSNDASEGDTSFTSSTGEVWTMNGTASIVDDQVATLEYSDDDYSTWTTAGEFKLTTSNPRIYRLGAYRGGRAWRLTHSADSAFRAQALKFEYDVGRH